MTAALTPPSTAVRLTGLMRKIAQLPSQRWTKKHLILVVGLAALIGVLVFVTLRTGLTEGLEAVVAGLREAGPVIFFVAMALLPAAGFPMLAFTLAAGPVFGPGLGIGWVIGWSLLAVLAAH